MPEAREFARVIQFGQEVKFSELRVAVLLKRDELTGNNIVIAREIPPPKVKRLTRAGRKR